MILEDIENGMPYKEVYKKDIKRSRGKNWKGSAGYLIFLFLFLLYFNTHIWVSKTMENTGPYLRQTNLKQFYDSLPFIDHLLIWMVKISMLVTFITAILLAINVKKAKYALYLVLLISIVNIIGSLVHINSQNLVYPSILSFIASLYLLMDYKMLPFKKENKA